MFVKPENESTTIFGSYPVSYNTLKVTDLHGLSCNVHIEDCNQCQCILKY